MRALGEFRLWTNRLRRSRAWREARRDPRLGFFFVNLWVEAWENGDPAGSLEDDDDALADAAMCPVDEWAAVADRLMKGWVRYRDGKIYHPVVVEAVLAVLAARQQYSKRTAAARASKARKRQEKMPKTDASSASVTEQSQLCEPLLGVGVVREVGVVDKEETLPDTSLPSSSSSRAGSPTPTEATDPPRPIRPPRSDDDDDGAALGAKGGQGIGGGQAVARILSAIEDVVTERWGTSRRPRTDDALIAAEWIGTGLSTEAIVDRAKTALLRSELARPPSSLRYCDAEVRTPSAPRRGKQRSAGNVIPMTGPTRSGYDAATEEIWRVRLKAWSEDRVWMRDRWGPAPDEPSCRCPPEIRALFLGPAQPSQGTTATKGR